jgi:hypothetical protein
MNLFGILLVSNALAFSLSDIFKIFFPKTPAAPAPVGNSNDNSNNGYSGYNDNGNTGNAFVPVNDNGNTNPGASESIANWETCDPISDVCAKGTLGNGEFTCCVSPENIDNGKHTCRTIGTCASDMTTGEAPGPEEPSTEVVAPEPIPVSSEAFDFDNPPALDVPDAVDSVATSPIESGVNDGLDFNNPPAIENEDQTESVPSTNEPVTVTTTDTPQKNQTFIDEYAPFTGVNIGIGSFFSADLASDSTNGNSWCGFPYKDHTNGFSPSLKRMTEGTGAVYGHPNWEKYIKKWCGLEALVFNPETGKSMLMFIIDAFDDKWVRSPGSIDIMKDSYLYLTDSAPLNKQKVIHDVKWELTGNRNNQYSGKGQGDGWI